MTIHWFRNDLRLHDNPALTDAIFESDPDDGMPPSTLPLYIIDPTSFAPLKDLNVPKAGPFRSRFLYESLLDLRNRLQQKGADLLIVVGQPADVLANLAKQFQATAVYAGQEATSEEVTLETDVRQALDKHNVPLKLRWMLTLYHPDDLPFPADNVPDNYRDFRRGCERQSAVRDEVPEPGTFRFVGPDDTATQTNKALTYLAQQFDDVRQDDRTAIHHVGGETAALDRLSTYFWERDQLRTYKFTRNNLLGEDYSSKFSAWLAYGCLSPRRIYAEVKRYEKERIKNVSTYWLIFELIWRDYFRFQALKQGAKIFLTKGPREVDTSRWKKDYELLERWAAGQTGVPFVDANMRELNATGYQSNRGRQNIASHLLNDLGVWWPWGAAYLESLLIDYDPASNWGNWNLVARNGVDARMDRYFNVYTQATKYDPKAEYVKRWCPELANVPPAKIHLIANLTPAEQTEYGVVLGKDYPISVFDMNNWRRKGKAKSH